MQQSNDDFPSWPPIVVASVPMWDEWLVLSCGAKPDGCDWLEVRLDMMPSSTAMENLDKVCPALPLLVTVRRPEEGGQRTFSFEERIKILEAWLPHAHAIDVEAACLLDAAPLIASAKERGVRVIASSHYFAETPLLEELLQIESEARKHGADIVKFAFKLNHPRDLQVGCELLARRSGDMAVMGMGDLGPCSRLLYAQLGSCLVYGYYGNLPSAPGQWPASEFKHALSMLRPVSVGH